MRPKTSFPAKAATAPETARQLKRSVERGGGFAEGGSGPANKMLGTGTRTVTAPEDAAVPAKGGATGKPQTAPGANTKSARGGPPTRSYSLGGLSRPAAARRTGPGTQE
jgi:hypothetical protein